MAELKEKLFSEFAPVSTEEWMAKITADLKGVPFEKKLVWKTGTLVDIDKIDFDGNKLYMFVLKLNDMIHHVVYIGRTKQNLTQRISERYKYGNALTKLMGVEQFVSCGKVTKEGISVGNKILKEVEEILIKELGTEQDQATKILLNYHEIESSGDIPDIHNFTMKWNETMKSDKYFSLPDFVSREYVVEK